MDDIVLAPFDYAKLDIEGALVRIRLESTCVNVRNAGDGAEVVYIRDKTLHRVAAAHVVLACFNMEIPYLMPEPEPNAARRAERQAPLVYSKVLATGTRGCGSRTKSRPHLHSRVKLDYR